MSSEGLTVESKGMVFSAGVPRVISLAADGFLSPPTPTPGASPLRHDCQRLAQKGPNDARAHPRMLCSIQNTGRVTWPEEAVTSPLLVQ